MDRRAEYEIPAGLREAQERFIEWKKFAYRAAADLQSIVGPGQ